MMLKNKLFLLSLILGISAYSSVNAQLTLKELDFPKPPAYRIGISSVPENQYVQVQEESNAPLVTPELSDSWENTADMTYADLSIKRLSKEISNELILDEQDMVADLTLLWQGAATQSDTINFALYKLANPDADKPDKQSLKNVLKTIASMSTLVGASMANPVFAGSSFIGSNILGIMTQDTKSLNYKYTKVNDADMIILIRKVEDLQQNAVDLYYDYMGARKQVESVTKLVEDRQKKFELAQKNNASRELIVITDAYYRSALDKQRSARSNFLSKRAALEQFVGNEAFNQFENELIEREKKENSSDNANSAEQEMAYNQTIQDVEDYTNKLKLRPAASPVMDYDSYSTQYNYDQDPNLKKLPDIAPLYEEKKVEPPVESAQTVKSEVAEKVDEEVKAEKPKTKEKKKTKEDKYSTKGIIFLHGMTKEQAKYSDQNQNSSNYVNNQPQQTIQYAYPQHEDPQLKMNKDFNLMPLDEIRPPRNGYSIYEDLSY